MSQVEKRPKRKQTVGALYVCFATDDTLAKYEDVIVKSQVVKSINTTENEETSPVYCSGIIYESTSLKSNDEISMEVVAFDVNYLAKMRGETIDTSGLILSGGATTRPYFAFGKVVKKHHNGFRFEWFPKCQLTSNTDDIKTSEASPSEQNDTLTITAMPFNDANDTKVYVDAESEHFPAGLTEEKFFSKVIRTGAELTALLGKTNEQQ